MEDKNLCVCLKKHDSNNILYDIVNIEKNERRNLKPYLIKNSSNEYNYKIKKWKKIYQK